MPGLTIRPMTPDDVPAAERLSDEGFYELDAADAARRPRRRRSAATAARSERWVARTLHFLRTDPGGCWVAEDETGLVGFATSFVRETTWCLATYVVRPGLQGRGIGRPLLDAALQHGRGLPARDAVGVLGPQGRSAATARPASTCTRRCS